MRFFCENGSSCPRARTGDCRAAFFLKSGHLKLQFTQYGVNKRLNLTRVHVVGIIYMNSISDLKPYTTEADYGFI